MRRIALFLLIMSITGVGIAAATTSHSISSFFFGDSAVNGQNENQELTLLVGARGAPGPAGVAGRSGAVGLNGKDGLAGARGPMGINGPAGAIGPQGPTGATGSAGLNGTSITSVTLAPGSSSCPNGGVKYVDGNNNTTYVCNGNAGVPGPQGPQGFQGAQGTQGIQGAPGNQLSNGSVAIDPCTSALTVNFQSQFTAEAGYVIGQVDVSNIPSTCNGQWLSVSFAVDTSTVTVDGVPQSIVSAYGLQHYNSGENIVCEQQITGISESARTGSMSLVAGKWNNGTYDPGSGDICKTQEVSNSGLQFDERYGTYNLDKVAMHDIANNIGIQISKELF